MAADWTVRVSVAVWESIPEVAVRVTVEDAEGAVMTAVSVVLCAAVCEEVGARVRVEGLAVTPVERPEMETVMEPTKELSEAAVSVMVAPAAPAVRAEEVGETVMEKSGEGVDLEPLPQAVRKMQRARQELRVSVKAACMEGIRRDRQRRYSMRRLCALSSEPKRSARRPAG
jgi:hypothetical protein